MVKKVILVFLAFYCFHASIAQKQASESIDNDLFGFFIKNKLSDTTQVEIIHFLSKYIERFSGTTGLKKQEDSLLNSLLSIHNKSNLSLLSEKKFKIGEVDSLLSFLSPNRRVHRAFSVKSSRDSTFISIYRLE